MDPTQALCEALDALLANDNESAGEAFVDLGTWLLGGGFAPSLTGAAVSEVMERAKRIGA